jgi:hypothetical protein
LKLKKNDGSVHVDGGSHGIITRVQPVQDEIFESGWSYDSEGVLRVLWGSGGSTKSMLL